MKKMLPIAALAILFAGCSNNNEQAAAPAAGSAAAPAATTASAGQAFQKGTAVTVADFALPGVTLTIDPNPYSGCDFPKGHAVLNIGYDARPAGVKHSQIWIQQVNGKQVLWGQSPGQIKAIPTGPWMVEGTRVLVVDFVTGKLVAASTVHAAACNSGG
jgi:hypothetical protein